MASKQHLGMMKMILVVVLMMDMLIVMSRTPSHLFLNLDRFVGLLYGISSLSLSLSLLDCPQVSKIEVQYDKTSKQVDVHALKETLWGHIQLLNQNPVEVKKSSFCSKACLFTLYSTTVSLTQTSKENVYYQEEAPEETISFKQILANFPENCKAAASVDEISTHLCFICLLHLANEHGLQILGCPSLDDLRIRLRPQNDEI